MTIKILVTGHGFVARALTAWLSRFDGRYACTLVSLRDSGWKARSWRGYDAVVHTAGIAHVSLDPKMESEYMRVDRDLAIEAAHKAKDDGARQFVFTSSSIVYGDSAPLGCDKLITAQTPPAPANFYGRSKLEAEAGIAPLAAPDFAVSIVRMPMVYGPGCKGNFPLLIKCARVLPVFPLVKNARSMIYIENLCEFLRLLIENRDGGTFWPQDSSPVCTSDLVARLAAAQGRKLRLTSLFNPALRLLRRFTPLVDKAFGSLRYDSHLSEYRQDYRVTNLEEALHKTLAAATKTQRSDPA